MEGEPDEVPQELDRALCDKVDQMAFEKEVVLIGGHAAQPWLYATQRNISATRQVAGPGPRCSNFCRGGKGKVRS